MNCTFPRKALFTLLAAFGLAIPVMSMDVGMYSKAYGKDAALLTNLINDMSNSKIPNDQIIARITQAPQLLKLRLRYGYTLLAAAANAGRLPVVQHILSEGLAVGVDGNVAANKEIDELLNTPLSLAAKKGHLNVVKYLLDWGPSRANLQKALEEAREAKQPAIVQLLQQKIAPTQPTATRPVQPPAVQPATRPGKRLTEDEQIALAIAESLKAQQPAMRPIVQPQQQPTAPASRELEALDALKNVEGRRYPQNYAAIKHIAGNIINNKGLPNATENAIQAIRQNKSFVNIEMQYGRTLLILAIQHGRSEIVRFLLDAGANINYPDEHGNTPLIVAAQNGKLEIVRLLLNRGATVNLFNEKKQTALNRALINKHQDVVTLLSQSKAKLFFTLVIAFTPPQAEQLARNTFQNLQRALQQSQQQDQMKNIELVPLEEVHLSMLYCSFFIDYNDSIEATTQDIFNTVYGIIERFGLRERCVNLTRSHQFLFTRLEKMGPYVVIRYNTPEGYQQLMNELFSNIQQAIRVPVIQTYGETQKPHISIAQEIKDRPKFTVDQSCIRIQANPLTTQAFQQGVYELNMRVPALGDLTRKSKRLFTTKHAWNAYAPAQLLFA